MQIHPDTLELFTRQVFTACGMSETDANTAAKALVAADRRGIDSHGVARLEGYVRLWEKGRANMQPKMRIIHETPSTATLDADSALGLVSAQKAMDIAIEKARAVGSGWVAIQHSNHFGIAAHHAMRALEHDMIGFAFTNASPLVTPTHGKERMLGTNPICVCFPTEKYPAFVLDMATSAASNGKLEIAERLHKPIPNNWVQKRNGETSTDASELKRGGSLLPLGGYKGYGLASMVDILCGVLSGANYGPWVPPFVAFLDPLNQLPGKGIGHFVGVFRVDAFRPAHEFKYHMDQWIERFKQSVPTDVNQPVLIPGQLEFEESIRRQQHGFELNDQVLSALTKLSNQFNIPFV